MSKRKSKRKQKRRMPTMKKYGLSLQTKPTDLSEAELAVLMGMTARLSSYDNIPGFDPTSAQLQITFASGRKGVARLVKINRRPADSAN